MNRPLILVTGAAGKTGAPTARRLLELGHRVRAMVRHHDARSRSLENQGAEVVEADFHDTRSLRGVVRGVERAYFCYPPAEGLLTATTNFAIAARDEGIEAIVNMSQISAREEAASPLSHEHWKSELVLDWSGVGVTHLRPGFFAEDLFLFTAGSIPRDGQIRLPFGEGKHAPVAAEDIASVAAGVLSNPGPHRGERYVLTGPTDLSMREIAGVFSTVLRRKVVYLDIPVREWKQSLLEDARMPEYLATHLAAVAVDHQNGVFSAETDIVERVGRRQPETVGEFARRHLDVFTIGQADAARPETEPIGA